MTNQLFKKTSTDESPTKNDIYFCFTLVGNERLKSRGAYYFHTQRGWNVHESITIIHWLKPETL